MSAGAAAGGATKAVAWAKTMATKVADRVIFATKNTPNNSQPPEVARTSNKGVDCGDAEVRAEKLVGCWPSRSRSCARVKVGNAKENAL